MIPQCCICDAPTGKGYYCNACYHTWHTDIMEKREWIRYLVNLEVNRRRKYQPQLIYLGSTLDISDSGKLVRKSDHA